MSGTPQLPANTLRFIASHGLRAVRVENDPAGGFGWRLLGNRQSLFWNCLIDEATKFPETPE